MAPERRHVLPSSPRFGIFTTDTHLVVRTWDPFVAEMTGMEADQVLNRPIGVVLPELADRGLLQLFARVVTEGTVQVLAPALHRYVTACAPSSRFATSEHMLQRVTIGPVREGGHISGVAVTIEDVTDRIERERELAERVVDEGAMPGIASGQTIDSLTRALGEREWRTRQAAVRGLAEEGPAIVHTLVNTLRDQHRNFDVLSSLLDLLAATDIDVVEPVMECLKNEDVDLRIQAALILGERRDRRAAPALIAALADPDANVRFHAIEALGILHATEAAESLVDIALGGDFFLAFPALQALSRMGDLSVAPRLVPLLNDELLRGAVAEALGELGDEFVVMPLALLLNEPQAPTEVIADALAGVYERYEARYGAGEQIASVARRYVSATGTQNLLDAVQRVESDRLRGIARVMGWLNGAAVQRALTRLLGQRAVRAQVVEALVRYGTGVVDLLIEQLRAEDLDTRQAAAVALGRIGDRHATRALLETLNDPELALPVAGALARIGDQDAFNALLDLLGHKDAAVRQAATAALNSIGHPEMPTRIFELLVDPTPVVRESAVKITGYFGYPMCVERAIACCADPSEIVRRAAVEHLPYLDHAGVIPALAHALEHDTPTVRAAAATAFARVEPQCALEPLLRALEDSDPWVRYFAVRSLGNFRNAGVAKAVRALLERDESGQVRLAAIDVLGLLDAAESVTVLEPLTASSDPDVARAAIRALGHTTDEHAAPILDGLLRSPDTFRRLEAVTATGARDHMDSASALQWVAAADSNRDVVNAAVCALVALSSRDGTSPSAAIDALIALTSEPELRESVIAGISGLPCRRIDDIAKGLRSPSADIRCATIEALSRMMNREASRWIETALDDDVAAVRTTAVGELRRLGSRHATKKLLHLAQTDPDIDVRHAAVMAISYQRGDRSASDHAERP
jgi:HEAT repeat protein